MENHWIIIVINHCNHCIVFIACLFLSTSRTLHLLFVPQISHNVRPCDLTYSYIWIDLNELQYGCVYTLLKSPRLPRVGWCQRNTQRRETQVSTFYDTKIFGDRTTEYVCSKLGKRRGLKLPSIGSALISSQCGHKTRVHPAPFSLPHASHIMPCKLYTHLCLMHITICIPQHITLL